METNEDLKEPDFEEDDFDNDGPQEPDYWYCSCCGTSVGKNPGGWGCPKCGSIMEEGYF